MSINRAHKVFRKNREVRWGPCVYLLDGPMTLEQLKMNYQKAPFPFSRQPAFYTEGNWSLRGLERLPDDLAGLVKVGLVVQKGDQFELTARGYVQVYHLIGGTRMFSERVSRKLRSFIQPEAASKVTLMIQIILAAIKLPAGILSGSVGLLNDSADTLLDLFSSLLVYLGIRFNKERLVSTLLVIFMLGTGSFTLYEAGKRVFTPYVPKVDWFPFAAALLSALTGLFLWTYQRYVGIHSGLMAFITESIDSRNHVIVALSVTAGLIASLLHFGVLDMLVGLVVAILILWSALQLTVDLVRSSGNEQDGISHYGFWMEKVYGHYRDAHLQRWMLDLVDCQEVRTRAELVERACQAFDYRNNPWMELVGLNRRFASDKTVELNLNELFSRGWVLDQEPLLISEIGKEYLDKKGKRPRE
jgi:hypothetical protein